ncbi:hypothetical protein WJX73_010392 [Symbiochloris irregularis]|uniref:Peptidylglycine monooxygenase n=1 Tax=Symbiochloris irregularis TaxID=706552 RepID=A0AAW1NYS9_9CHLO
MIQLLRVSFRADTTTRDRLGSGRQACQSVHELPALLVVLATLHALQAAPEDSQKSVEVHIPEHPAEGEIYLCTRVPLPNVPQRLVAIEPLSKQDVVHHMILYGCATTAGSSEPVWECIGHGVCGSAGQQVLYGWGKDAPAMSLPPGVGFHVGEGSAIHSLVLQVHYLNGRPAGDTSGVRLSMTSEHMPFAAGMLMYASAFSIPPGRPSTEVPNHCCISGFEPAHGFAFRVHTHALGRSVWLDKLDGDRKARMVEYSPQLPQGFTPVNNMTFWPGETLEATCDYDSRSVSHVVRAGSTHHDEMCNLYFMMWTEMPIFLSCYNHARDVSHHGPGGIPTSATLQRESDAHWAPPQPRSAATPAGEVSFGQLSGVAKGHNGTLWVLHRGPRIWDSQSFADNGVGERTQYDSAVEEDVLLQLDQDTGEVLAKWGKGDLYLPHMMTVDREGSVWAVDVALHQVVKYSSAGRKLLELGVHLQPGHDDEHFCKPTQVALSNSGTVYVSDGYCNSRVQEFGPDGSYRGTFQLPLPDKMQTPHSLTLDECGEALYVADREGAKVHSFNLRTRQYQGSWNLQKEGKVYAIAIGPYGLLLALCWDRDGSGSPGHLVLLGRAPGEAHAGVWQLQGAQAPHDFALVAAPVRLAGRERPLAVVVAESRPQGSRLLKYLLMPPGSELTSDPANRYPSASTSWQQILAATAKPIPQARLPQTAPMNMSDARASLGYNESDAVLVSIPLAVLALVLVTLLWRLAAPAVEEDPVHMSSL